MSEHVPVLLHEVLELLRIRPSGVYLDATVGLGGHAREILKQTGPAGRLIGLDRDGEALAIARKRLPGDNVTLMSCNFGEMETCLTEVAVASVDGILMDLGVSSHQLDTPSRGFGFRWEGPLDMRMNPAGAKTAADLVNRLSERDLADLIYRYGEEHRSRSIARAIVKNRPIRSTSQLAEVIAAVAPRTGRTHPATRTFQALRIAVNDELDVLGPALRKAAGLLNPGGRLCVIAYHSLEDRIVKDTFRELRSEGYILLTKKPVVPERREILENPRARSAKLRALERVN